MREETRLQFYLHMLKTWRQNNMLCYTIPLTLYNVTWDYMKAGKKSKKTNTHSVKQLYSICTLHNETFVHHLKDQQTQSGLGKRVEVLE